MGATSGIAVALGRSAPPQPTTFAPDASPAFILSGYELPPELTPARWLTEWRLDWLWIAVAALRPGRLLPGRRQGAAAAATSGQWFRTVNWVIGLLVLTYITSGPPAVYGRVLFSAHMVDHMALTMVAPIFLVLGAPVTLALRALPARGDGSRGLREWLLVFVHSKFSQLVTHPLFAAANFAGSIVLFYYSDAFGFAMRDHVGHELMNLHFALTGYIFVLSMIGTDPLPRRAPYPMRLLLLLATMGFHAFFGVAIMGGTGLLAADYFGNLGRAWGPSALLDQQMGGAVAWGIGEVPTLLVAIGVAVMWSRSDARESKRTDRAADRNNDADLTAYNDMFAKLAERDAKLAERNKAGRTLMSETVRTHLRVRASELVGRNWLNTGGKSLDLEALRGKIVLLDFWTFCCINCLHVLDELRPLEEQYSDVLVTVGVHSPKFEHEADPVALAAAVERYEIHHPVLDDPELDTWKAYTARAWPTLVVIDPEGYIVAHLSGEGHADGLAVLIPELIAEHEAKGTLHRGSGPYVAPEADVGHAAFPRQGALPPGRPGPLLPGRPQRSVRRGTRGCRADAGSWLVTDTGHHRLVELDTDFDTVLRTYGSGHQGPRRRPRRRRRLRQAHRTVQRAAGPGPAAGRRGSEDGLRRRHCRLRQPPPPRAVPHGRNGHHARRQRRAAPAGNRPGPRGRGRRRLHRTASASTRWTCR